MFKLRPIQKMALPAIEWLLSDDDKDRRSGRTHLLALVALRMAIIAKGPVGILDHVPSTSRDPILDYIADIAKSIELPGVRILKSQGSIEVVKPTIADTASINSFHLAVKRLNDMLT